MQDIYTVSPGDVVTYTYELQVCGNVKASSSAACSSPSPINRISADGKTCDKMGDLGVSSFYQNPFKDGAYLSLWGGDDVDHIHKWQSRIYFQCNPNATEPRPYFEHSTDYNQAHFKVRYGRAIALISVLTPWAALHSSTRTWPARGCNARCNSCCTHGMSNLTHIGSHRQHA